MCYQTDLLFLITSLKPCVFFSRLLSGHKDALLCCWRVSPRMSEGRAAGLYHWLYSHVCTTPILCTDFTRPFSGILSELHVLKSDKEHVCRFMCMCCILFKTFPITSHYMFFSLAELRKAQCLDEIEISGPTTQCLWRRLYVDNEIWNCQFMMWWMQKSGAEYHCTKPTYILDIFGSDSCLNVGENPPNHWFSTQEPGPTRGHQ